MSTDNGTMNDEDIDRDDPMMAAEYALGLLEGEELLMARGREAAGIREEGDFAWRKAWWDNWFAPWTDEMKGAEPGPHVWAAISSGIDANRAAQAEAEMAGGGGSAANVVDLQSRLKRWQWTAGLTSAAAAVMLAVMAFSPGTGPAPAPGDVDAPVLAAAEPLVAQVPIGDTGLRLDVTYIPESEKLLVGAIGLTADGVHDHELWLVPADGSDLQSLGLVAPGEVRSVALSQDIVGKLDAEASLVLTREPIGGKPEGVDAGPVVAEGAFSRV